MEPSEPTNVQSSVSKAASSEEVEMEEESQEEPETSADSAEVSGAKAGDAKMSQTLLEQVQHILIYNDQFESAQEFH